MSLIGASFFYYLFSDISLFISFVSLFLGAMPGLILVVFFEMALLQLKKLDEMKHQSQILENINKKLK